MASYKGITFAKGYNRSFADFKKEFGSTHIFKGLYPKQRELELKKAHKIAIKGNGNISKPTAKSKKANTSKGKKGSV